jgi:hypothetical protein
VRKVAYRIVMKNGEPISQWTDIQFMEQANLHPSRVIEYAYAAPVVTDELAARVYRYWNVARGRAALGIEGDMSDGLGMMKRAITAALGDGD